MPKPTRKKKHFIRKKEATTYRLIPGYVEDEEDTLPTETEEAEKRKEEQRHFGIYYDDGYNYMKHLRGLDEAATMVNTKFDGDETVSIAPSMRSSMPLPFREFFSTDETEDEKIDPEILAALEDAPVVPMVMDDDESADKGEDLDFLDDDFVVQAGGAIVKEYDDEEEYFEEDDREHDFDEEEEDYSESDDESVPSDRLSVSSYEEDEMSNTRRREGRGTAEDDMIEAQTALILKNFEQGLGFRVSTQDTPDDQEVPTPEDLIHLTHVLKSDKLKEEPTSWTEVFNDKKDIPKIDTSKYLYEDEDEYEWKEMPPSKPKFDCVSILSTRSNTRNLPTDIILPPKEKTKKKRDQSECESGAPPSQGLTLQQLEQEMRESRRADRASTFRPEDETVEEKRARKKSIKDERKERRQEKKANKMVFSIENEKMKKDTAMLSKAVKSVKLA